ncbi:MAG TPA: hypothetical protein V6D10_00465 [Trichocoleus sp.]|jgi:hypothetical protein
MPEILEPRQSIPLSTAFFCDGHYYVLTSASLGGSGLQPEEISDALSQSDEQQIEALLRRGVCIPLFFDGDCALDNNTVVVLGDLTEQEKQDWIGHLSWKLNIPCGQFIILCGGGDGEDFAYAISGNPPDPHYQFFQAIEVPPGEYLVQVYAYFSSMSVQLLLEEYDEKGDLQENEELRQWYQTNRPGCADIGYIIQLVPLETEPPFPKLVPEIGWCGEFEFRQSEL